MLQLHPWLEKYILLALQIDKIFRKSGDCFVDSYMGPKELSEIVEREDYKNISELMKHTSELIQTLPKQNFEEKRFKFLEKQVQAIEMTLRILNGEEISFNKQVKSCLDIELKWIPEEHFEQGIELYKQGLPGKGDIFNRFDNWNERNIYSFKKKSQKRDIINSAIDEIRRRTKKVIDLPHEEKIKLEMVSNKSFGAANWYQGNYHSLVQINEDIPLNIFCLLPIMSHELYPGHHTEFCMKEIEYRHIRNYPERQIYLVISPQLVTSEGIAEIAFDMIFTPEEAAKWMVENIYKDLDIKTDDIDLACLIRAARINSLDQISGNASIMLNDGCSEEQVKKYIKKYTLQSDEMINHVINSLKKSIFRRIYSFSYFNGKNIVRNLSDRQEKQYEKFNCLLRD